MRLRPAVLLALVSVATTMMLGRSLNKPSSPAGAPVPESQAMPRRAMRNRPVVYVADSRAKAILVYRPDGGSPIGKISVGISSPTGLATDHAPFRFALGGGNSPLLYVADPVGHDVVIYNYTTGRQQSTIFEGLKTASAIALDPGAPF